MYDFILVCPAVLSREFKNSLVLSCTMFVLFDVQNIVTLKSRLGVIQGQ